MFARDINAIGIEGRQVDDGVLVLVRAAHIHRDAPDLQAIDVVGPERPVGRVHQLDAFDEHALRPGNIQEPRPLLPMDQVADSWETPPHTSLAVDLAAALDRHIPRLVQLDALQQSPRRLRSRPLVDMLRKPESTIDAKSHGGQPPRENAPHHVEDLVRQHQSIARGQMRQRLVHQGSILPRDLHPNNQKPILRACRSLGIPFRPRRIFGNASDVSLEVEDSTQRYLGYGEKRQKSQDGLHIRAFLSANGRILSAGLNFFWRRSPKDQRVVDSHCVLWAFTGDSGSVR
eukprot:scaffold1610_cov257-Pinguiococcus_pyrenoidosus.AAC.44